MLTVSRLTIPPAVTEPSRFPTSDYPDDLPNPLESLNSYLCDFQPPLLYPLLPPMEPVVQETKVLAIASHVGSVTIDTTRTHTGPASYRVVSG